MKKYDIAVIGGGFAGVAAALAAARCGSRVLLVEKSNCLGGAAGIASSLAASGKTDVRDINVCALQSMLRERGAFLGI